VRNRILVLDTETTGIANHPILGHPEVIELAYVEIVSGLEYLRNVARHERQDLIDLLMEDKVVTRYRPEMPIHPEAYKVHGILLKDLLKEKRSHTCELPLGAEYIIGHNISFDARCLGLTTRFKEVQVKQICTMGLAKALEKKFKIGLTSFKLDNLIVHFYEEDARPVIKEYHAASTDVIKTILLLIKLIEYLPAIKTIEELYDFQQSLKKIK
jgi:DNA polymerase III epsilon subunit-like protein